MFHIGKLSCYKLMTLSTWPKWRTSEHQQLHHFDLFGMHGTPCPPPKPGIGAANTTHTTVVMAVLAVLLSYII
jgi:hypothetical protein